MNEMNFIKEKIDFLIEKYPMIKIRHEFREHSDVHLIEVSPSVVYQNDKELLKDINNIYSEHYEKRISEDIHFSDNFEIMPLSDNAKEYCGKMFLLLGTFDIKNTETIPNQYLTDGVVIFENNESLEYALAA